MTHKSDKPLFGKPSPTAKAAPTPVIGFPSIKVLIVDDEEEVHNVTRMVLRDFNFEGRALHWLSAYSGQEAIQILQNHPDIAVILLDVVMETDQAGLDVAREIRSRFPESLVRIILRTGHPGQAPEREVIRRYDINDYREKTELTAEKLFSTMTTAIRSYRDLKIIEENRSTLSNLAMSVAHQVRNPVASIGGFAGRLLRKRGEDELVRQAMEIIMDESRKLEGLVRAVGEYARLPKPDRAAVDTATVEQQVQVMAMEMGKRLGREMIWTRKIGEGSIFLDPEIFAMVWKGLLENCFDFTGSGPVHIHFEVTPFSGGTSLELTDQGPGIDTRHLPHLFDPFFTTKNQGLGMGLCMVRRIVRDHCGEIRITSEPDKGTRVVILLPDGEMVCGRGR